MEVIEEKAKEVVEQIEDKVEITVEEIEKKVEDKVEEVAKKLDEKTDWIPSEVKTAVESKLVEVVDGSAISCSCFGFLWSLRISRKSPPTPPSKSEDSQNTPKPQPTLSIRTPV